METETLNPKGASQNHKTKLTTIYDMVVATCRTYKNNVRKFSGLVWRVFAVYFVYSLITLIYSWLIARTDAYSGWNFFFERILVVLIILAFLYFVYYSVRLRASVMLMIKNGFNSPLKTFAESKKYFWPLIFLFALIIARLSLLSVLLFIPGLIFLVFYYFAVYSYIFEGFKGRAALKRSRELVKGYWWQILGRLIVIGLFFVLVTYILNLPAQLFSSNVFSFIYGMITKFIQILLVPLSIIYINSIFQDLLKIKGESKLEKNPTKKQNTIDLIFSIIMMLVIGYVVYSSIWFLIQMAG